MMWVTRERSTTDRIACPWLIRTFIDPEAEFLCAPALLGVGDLRQLEPSLPVRDALYVWCRSEVATTAEDRS